MSRVLTDSKQIYKGRDLFVRGSRTGDEGLVYGADFVSEARPDDFFFRVFFLLRLKA